MKTFDVATIARLEAGEVDYIDAITLVFDSGVVNGFIGGHGQFDWNDGQIGAQTFYGLATLVEIEVPASVQGSDSSQIRIRQFETYMEEDSDIPVNVFDDGVRATIDEEEWEGRDAILSVFWRAADGSIIEREQVAVRQIDAMPVEFDEAGNPVRVIVLEEPDIIQRDIEGKTANAAFQALIDAADKGLEHAGTVRTDKINWGRVSDESAS